MKPAQQILLLKTSVCYFASQKERSTVRPFNSGWTLQTT
jgi:hypothetical protein